MNIYIPFSGRSFGGIMQDTLAWAAKKFPDQAHTVVPIVMEHEVGSTGLTGFRDIISVSPKGEFELQSTDEDGRPVNIMPATDSSSVVVVNGGMTPQTVAAVRLAQRLFCKAVNIQRDGVEIMTVL